MASDEVKLAELFDKAKSEVPGLDSKIIARSITEEIVTPIEGKLKGKIPEWLKGTLLYNGPGQFTLGDKKLNHLFDGMAILQKFKISSDKVTYQNKMLQSEAYTKGRENNRIMFGEFGTPAAAQNLFKKIINFGNPNLTDNAAVTIYPISDNYYAITESPFYYKINPETLEALERVDLAKKIEIVTITAHPHIMTDGVAYNVAVSITKKGAVYNVICFPKGEDIASDAIVVAKVPARYKFHPSYMHSFGVTENFFIIYETPLVISVPALVKSTIVTAAFLKCMKWLEGETTKITLVDRATGTVRHTFYADPFFCFHTINQFEKNDEVIFDMICYNNGSIVEGLLVEKLAKEDPERAKSFSSLALRFVMPTVANDKNVNLLKLEGSSAKAILKDDGKIHLTPEILNDFGFEFPRVNYPKYCGIEYKYFYGVGRDGSILKVDTSTKEKTFWKHDKAFTFEPIFVPSPESKEEDDGVLVVGYIKSEPDNEVGLAILDAKDLKELARAEFTDLPSPITKPFHGWFIGAK